MDLEIIILKWSKLDRGGKISYDITYMWNLKKKRVQINIYKTEIELQM